MFLETRMSHTINAIDYDLVKHTIFDGDKFDCWKYIIESFFLGYDANLWHMITNRYTHHLDTKVVTLERNQMNEQQKMDKKNHHRSKNIMLYAISYLAYENIRNKDSAKSIFDSLVKTHE